jgi:FkbM family methyltransferase
MIGNILLKLLMLSISIIDRKNKIKIIKFFKNNIRDHTITVIDVGAHKGETIDLFNKNFNIKKIYSFEPNVNLFKTLKTSKKYINNKIEIFNLGFGDKNEERELNVFNDTSSSTINYINENTNYFKRKKKFMYFFSRNKNFLIEKQKVKIRKLSEFISEKLIDKIDILKLDTEGYEYNIIKNLDQKDFAKIRFIYFEHHYDLMINKGYKFFDINNILIKNKFQKKYKIRMKFRKSFEYIYENSR